MITKYEIVDDEIVTSVVGEQKYICDIRDTEQSDIRLKIMVRDCLKTFSELTDVRYYLKYDHFTMAYRIAVVFEYKIPEKQYTYYTLKDEKFEQPWVDFVLRFLVDNGLKS